MCDRQLLIAGKVAADAVHVGDGEVVVGARPVLRCGLARPSFSAASRCADCALEVVGVIAQGTREVAAAEPEADIGERVLRASPRRPRSSGPGASTRSCSPSLSFCSGSWVFCQASYCCAKVCASPCCAVAGNRNEARRSNEECEQETAQKTPHATLPIAARQRATTWKSYAFQFGGTMTARQTAATWRGWRSAPLPRRPGTGPGLC